MLSGAELSSTLTVLGNGCLVVKMPRFVRIVLYRYTISLEFFAQLKLPEILNSYVIMSDGDCVSAY